jgi:hypothetical protein
VAYTAIFCLVEWQLFHPYTIQDLVIRSVAALVAPLDVHARRPERTVVWLAQLATASAAGVGAVAVTAALPAGHSEARLHLICGDIQSFPTHKKRHIRGGVTLARIRDLIFPAQPFRDRRFACTFRENLEESPSHSWPRSE